MQRSMTALVAATMLILMGALVPATAARAGGATLTIHHRWCPAGYAGPDFYGACHDTPVADWGLRLEGAEARAGRTDASGNATFAELAPGGYEVFGGGGPTDFVGLNVFCAPVADPGTRFPSTTTPIPGGPGAFVVALTLGAGDAVVCDFYLIPADLGPPAPSPASGVVPVVAVAYTCPDADALLSECDDQAGVTIRVAADGTAIAGSPFTTALNSIGFNAINFNVASEATLTLTQLSGVPAGYQPAPGYVPFTIDVDDLQVGGCGGESTCRYIRLFNVPTSGGTAPATEPVVSQLPNTGTGTRVSDIDDRSAGVLALAALLALGLGVAVDGDPDRAPIGMRSARYGRRRAR